MNPNHMPYGQPLPMQPSQRRHDGSYPQMPPHMRSHPGYQPYYPQHMAPMIPQYPQHYGPNWYPYQQQQMHPMHQPRPHYYPQAPVPPQYPQQHVPMSQQMHPQPSPRPLQTPANPSQLPPPSSTSTSSAAPVQTPPSPPLSTSTTVSARKEVPSQTASPGPQRVQSPQIDGIPGAERFYPPTPWLSVEDNAFPPRAPRRRRQIRRSQLANEPVTYPLVEPVSMPEPHATADSITPKAKKLVDSKEKEVEVEAPSIHTPTPLTSDAPSETVSTQPTTPSSPAPMPIPKSQETPTQVKSRPIQPVVPVVPVLPASPSAVRKANRDSVVSSHSKTSDEPTTTGDVRPLSSTVAADESAEVKVIDAPAPPKPTSWASLVRATLPQTTAAVRSANVSSNGVITAKGETLSEVLNDVNTPVEPPTKVSFLQPRGLVNTGNMCYMNSVLQVLVFSVPFYDFLSKIAQRAPHTFKSDTPLIDALILFVQEYRPLDTATSPDQLRLRLRPDDYENYGEPFIPEYVYSAIKHLPRFKEMRRGHQQDAQEFLGFLLEELHEECSRAMRSGPGSSSGRSTPLGSVLSVSDQTENETGWMEVGHKQKPAVTRSSGSSLMDSPVSSIFGGKLRSELKITGNKLSVTLEPYSPLQLDIGSPEVSNIIDALKGLTRAEAMQGEFLSSKGQQARATKQVFIETLPPVLILHLKRFHYDNTTKRAEKIWKQVGYPLELEIPKEVFPTSARNRYSAHGGLPKYRLTGVIYHHGKYASGGHYTVDIRRQDGNEWIRLDDTVIRRIRSDDVAEGGSEEDPKVLAAALERHKQGKTPTNRFEQIEQDEEEEASDKVWSQVNGHSRGKSSVSAMVNGAATPAKTSGPQTPREKTSARDNKVAYLLFYQKIGS